MDWKERFFTTGRTTLHYSVNFLADAFTLCGTLACVFSGASYKLVETFENSGLELNYYGLLGGHGSFNVSLHSERLDLYKSHFLPIQPKPFLEQGRLTYHLSDHVSPSEVQFASIIAFTVGFALRLVGDNLSRMNRSRAQRSYFKKEANILIPKPSYKELAYESVASSCGSASLTLLGYLITSAITDPNGQSIPFTLPQIGRFPDNTTYPGPILEHKKIIQENVEFDSSIGPIDLYEFVNATGILLGNLGISGSFKLGDRAKENAENVKDKRVIAGCGSGTAYLLYRFFKNKSNLLENKRLQQRRPLNTIEETQEDQNRDWEAPPENEAFILPIF